jgi:DNA-binding LacI/PurR family transcriptional regulator
LADSPRYRNDPAVTLRDVAQAAGVSLTTCSVALSGRGRVSEETRRHVQDVARRLSYVANPAARRLRQSRIEALGLYIPGAMLDLEYYMQFAIGACERAHERDYSVTLLAPLAARNPQRLLIDGAIVPDPLLGDPISGHLIGSDLLTVTSDNYLDPAHPPTGVVQSDAGTTLRRLLEHFAERGIVDPWFVAPEDNSGWARALRQEYLGWCSDHRIKPRLNPPSSFRITPEQIIEATSLFLAAARPRDGIICGSFAAAIAISRAARARGRLIGDDLLVAACSDHSSTLLQDPPITVIDLKPRELGIVCVDLLIDLLQGKAEAGAVRHGSGRLKLRASSAGA